MLYRDCERLPRLFYCFRVASYLASKLNTRQSLQSLLPSLWNLQNGCRSSKEVGFLQGSYRRLNQLPNAVARPTSRTQAEREQILQLSFGSLHACLPTRAPKGAKSVRTPEAAIKSTTIANNARHSVLVLRRLHTDCDVSFLFSLAFTDRSKRQ